MPKRVYFAFHYQDVIDFRANVVRNHNFLDVESAGYYDHSIWEEAKKTSPLALKRLINAELQNTSVTAVLIGTLVSLHARSSGNELILSWPMNAIGFTLQSTLNLTFPATWIDSTNAPATVGAQFTVTNTIVGSGQFYRLKK